MCLPMHMVGKRAGQVLMTTSTTGLTPSCLFFVTDHSSGPYASWSTQAEVSVNLTRITCLTNSPVLMEGGECPSLEAFPSAVPSPWHKWASNCMNHLVDSAQCTGWFPLQYVQKCYQYISWKYCRGVLSLPRGLTGPTKLVNSIGSKAVG